MRARPIAFIALLAAGCPAESAADSEGEAGQGSSGSETSAADGGASMTSPPTTAAGETTDDGDPATAGVTSDATTMTPQDSGDDGDTGDSGDSDTGKEPVGTPGCMAEESLADGEHEFMLDGFNRRYILRLPANYSSDQPWPLIFALHGNGGNTGYWDATGGDRDIRTAFADDAILVIPEAINNAWRDYDASPDTWPAGIDLELNYFDTILQDASDGLCLDTHNIFSMGFSGGGSFSGVLGCRRDYIRAIAVGGSVIYFEEEDCVETPAAWITIGEGEFNSGREAFRDFFRDLAGCEASSMPGQPGGCEDYDSCGADTPVTYCSHPAGHVWPSIGTDATKAFFENFYLTK